MKLAVKKVIGKNTYNFQVEGKNLYEVLIQSRKLSFYDVDKCGLCKSDNIVLDAHIAKDKFKYATIKCLGCKGSVNFGQQQEDPDTFYITTKEGSKELNWKPFEPKN